MLLQIADIFSELLGNVSNLCADNKWGVIIALINAAEDRKQIEIIKELRTYFKSSTSETESLFVPNVLTLNGIGKEKGNQIFCVSILSKDYVDGLVCGRFLVFLDSLQLDESKLHVLGNRLKHFHMI